MLSFFKERKKKISTLFNDAPNTFKYSFTIQVKDVVFGIHTNQTSLGNYIKQTYQEFIVDKPADYVFNFHNHTKSVVIDVSENESYTYDFIQFFDTYFYYRYGKQEPIVDIALPSKFEFWEFENFFKIFISSISLKFNALLIHASAVVKDNEIILFSGQSGAGKSTIAGLSGYPIIHDDNILISHLGDGLFELETIPFKIPYKKNTFTGKIKGFYRLFQHDETFIRDIEKNKQLTHLLFGLWAFDHFGNKNTMQYNANVMKYCTEIVPHLKIKELYFTKTNDFLKLV
ncbi:HprK-related kinase B [Kordia sp. SMS9]|uniref:hypothetical protein n=1 Tax=Kordia sp. SMS9 TaxID=2282170 RepID=UPI000E0DAFB4|nr:hypothetical protein [Kordia sp. SMS9]AXG70711.1 HprK-related kinase B [Kordia sp. SMS9]